jgi:hypothetical protein
MEGFDGNGISNCICNFLLLLDDVSKMIWPENDVFNGNMEVKLEMKSMEEDMTWICWC